MTTTTWNGALTNSIVGEGPLSQCLSYWYRSGSYANRSQHKVNADMKLIFQDDPKSALAIIFGLRLISRKPKSIKGCNVKINDHQSGFGRRDEFYKCCNWLLKHNPNLLYQNLHLIPVFGSWKDFVNEPFVSTLDRAKVYSLVKDNIKDPLLLKYLPQIRCRKQVRSNRDLKRVMWAKGLCKYLGISYKEYSKMKSQGIAHKFQQIMSHQNWDQLNFSEIPGKAFHNLSKGQSLERHNQIDRLKEWIDQQDSIKFNGYPHELVKLLRYNVKSKIKELIADKQFLRMLKTYENHNLGNVLCALDTSWSMTEHDLGGFSPYDLCLGLGITFSSLNNGFFKDIVLQFSYISNLYKLSGSFSDKLKQCQSINAMGSTNFQSAIDLLVKIKKENPEIPAEQYPDTLLVISDMQFDPGNKKNNETNYKIAMSKLSAAGIKPIKIIWWLASKATSDFPSTMNDPNVYMVGGFDPSMLKTIFGLNQKNNTVNYNMIKRETPLDGFKNFLYQPIFELMNFSGLKASPIFDDK